MVAATAAAAAAILKEEARIMARTKVLVIRATAKTTWEVLVAKHSVTKAMVKVQWEVLVAKLSLVISCSNSNKTHSSNGVKSDPSKWRMEMREAMTTASGQKAAAAMAAAVRWTLEVMVERKVAVEVMVVRK